MINIGENTNILNISLLVPDRTIRKPLIIRFFSTSNCENNRTCVSSSKKFKKPAAEG